MDKTPLYQQIAESVRQEILYGDLRPGDRLPSIRDMATRWECTLGTAQRAYQELAQQGIVISHSGQGTHVRTAIPAEDAPPLRQAALVNRAEKFLLEALMTGYAPEELLGKSSRLLYLTQEDFDYVGLEKYRQVNELGLGTVETRWKRKDGAIIDIYLSSSYLIPGDPSSGVTFTALDITDRKRAEEALQRAHDKI